MQTNYKTKIMKTIKEIIYYVLMTGVGIGLVIASNSVAARVIWPILILFIMLMKYCIDHAAEYPDDFDDGPRSF